MHWFAAFNQKSKLLNAVGLDVAKQAQRLAAAMSKQVKAAGSGINFYIDPKLAQDFSFNLHAMEQNDADRVAHRTEKTADGKAAAGEDFMEETVSFHSKKTADSNYLCSVVMQKPENKLYCVSVYMVESYLGRFAFKANYYFRDGSRRAAEKCYSRVARAVRELRQDMMDDDVVQSRVPHLMKRRLAGIEGEIEPRINKVSTYLDPANSGSNFDPAKQFSTYIPTQRSITDDLLMKG